MKKVLVKVYSSKIEGELIISVNEEHEVIKIVEEMGLKIKSIQPYFGITLRSGAKI